MSTSNICKAENAIKMFFETKILNEYTFKDWKECFLFSSNNDEDSLLKKWDIFSKDFRPAWVDPQARASSDAWDACLVIEYRWEVKGQEIRVRLALVKGEIAHVVIGDMLGLFNHFGSDFDFANEFANIALMYELKKSN